MVCDGCAVSEVVDTNAVMNAVASVEYTTTPPAIAEVKVVPTPVIVVPDWNAVPTAYVVVPLATSYATDGKLVVPAMVLVPCVRTKLALVPASGIVYIREAAGAVELMVVVFVVPNVSCDVAAVSVSEAKVGVDATAMFCGVDNVIVPAPFVTDIWLAVPVSVVATGAAAVLPTNSCPFVRAAASTMAPVDDTIMRLFDKVAEEFVPPLAVGNVPVTCDASDTLPVVRLRLASVCTIALGVNPSTLMPIADKYPEYS